MTTLRLRLKISSALEISFKRDCMSVRARSSMLAQDGCAEKTRKDGSPAEISVEIGNFCLVFLQIRIVCQIDGQFTVKERPKPHPEKIARRSV
jgi:hypothetical protein